MKRTIHISLILPLAGLMALAIVSPPDVTGQVIMKKEKTVERDDWTSKYCEEGEKCEVKVEIHNGEHLVVVNGDTIDVAEMDHLEDLGTAMFELGLDDDYVFWNHPRRGQMLWHHRWDRDPMHGPPNPHRFRMFSVDRDETLQNMEKRARALARDVRRADRDERADLEAELDKKLAEIFDYKSDRRRRQLEDAEQDLTEMKTRLNKRMEARDKIIEHRKQELLGEESYLEW
jgi:hypothetical protein